MVSIDSREASGYGIGKKFKVYPNCAASAVLLSNNLAFEIVIVGFGDLYIHELADRQFLIGLNDHFIVYFHTVGFSSAEVTAGFFLSIRVLKVCRSFLVLLVTDLLLHFHDLLCTCFFFFSRYRVFQFRRRWYFLRVSK